MSNIKTCFGCGAPIRRGYPMVTQSGKDVIICERCKRLCKRLWQKAKAEEEKAEEEKAKGADDE